MANKRISDLPPIPAIAADDAIEITDTSEGTSTKGSWATVLDFLYGYFNTKAEVASLVATAGACVDSLSALDALDATVYKSATLNVPNRLSKWLLVEGNFVDHHAADVLGGYYRPASGYASSAGSWVAQRDDFSFNPHLMGIAPVYDPADLAAAPDMSVAYQSCFDLCHAIFPDRTRGLGGEIRDNVGYVRLDNPIVFPGPVKFISVANLFYYGTGIAFDDPADDGLGGPLLSGDKHQFYHIELALRDGNGNTSVPTSRNDTGTVGIRFKRMQNSYVKIRECNGFTRHNLWLDSSNSTFTGQHIQGNTFDLGYMTYGGSGAYSESVSAANGAVQGNTFIVRNVFSNFEDFVLGPDGDINTNNNTVVMLANDDAATGQPELSVGGGKNNIFIGFCEGDLVLHSSSNGNVVDWMAASLETVAVANSGTDNLFSCNGVPIGFAADGTAKRIAGLAAGTSSAGNLDFERLGASAANRTLHGTRSFAKNDAGDRLEMAATYATQISDAEGDLHTSWDWFTRYANNYARRLRLWAGLAVGNVADPGLGNIAAENGYYAGTTAGVTGAYATVDVIGGIVTGGTAGTAGPTRVVKSADESLTSDVVLQDDAALAFAMLANTKYSIELSVMVMTVSPVPNFQFAFSSPAGASAIEYAYTVNNAGGQTLGANSGSLPSGAFALNGSQPCYFKFFITFHNGANAGDFKFRWAQNTSDANAVTVRAGSFLEYQAAA